MQYFTFLGLGNPEKGYEELSYSFENEPDQISVSRFVQKAIIEKFNENIDEVIVFATKESMQKYENQIKEEMNYVNFNFIQIPINIEFEDFTKQMLKILREDESFIMDITHSFRNIPMKLLFALRYIELSSNVTLEHLYYGKLIPNTSEGVIVDLIKNYRLQIVSDLLSQFDRSLILASKDVEALVKMDENIIKFLKALAQFNDMIELCEFDRCIPIINNILLNCSIIEKNAEEYILIIPLIKKIKAKFNTYITKQTIKDKKEELIKIMLHHNRYQIATTFTDQFLREELIHYVFAPSNNDFDINTFKLNGLNLNNNEIYMISQMLLGKVRRNKWPDIYDDKIYDAVLDYEYNYNKCDVILSPYKRTISSFYDNVRNHMNHGTSIKESAAQVKIKESIMKILECINKLEKVRRSV